MSETDDLKGQLDVWEGIERDGAYTGPINVSLCRKIYGVDVLEEIEDAIRSLKHEIARLEEAAHVES